MSDPSRDRRSRGLDLLVGHWHHLVLTLWLAVCVAIYGRHGGQSWHFFASGARSLLCFGRDGPGSCGLHLYAAHPDLQIGPLSLLLAAPAVALRRQDGFDLARTGMAAAGLLVIWLVEQGVPVTRPGDQVRRRLRTLLAGAVLLPAWADLAVGFGHLDDVLALLFTAAAVYCIRREAGRSTGLLLAAAIVSKPWAVAFLPLVAALPRGRRRDAALLAVGIPVLVALPFLLADHGSLRAGAFRIPNAPSSALRVLGVRDATPAWDRPAQFGLGALLGLTAVLRGRWAGVVLVAAAMRIMLDPQVYSYYSAGLLIGAMIWDVQMRPGRVLPIWTWSVFAGLFACRYTPLPAQALGVLRLVVCVIVVLCAVFVPGLLARVLPARVPAAGADVGPGTGADAVLSASVAAATRCRPG